MGAETEAQEKHAEDRPRPSPITLTQDQFLSWKRQKNFDWNDGVISKELKNFSLYVSVRSEYFGMPKRYKDAAESARKAETSRKRAEDIAAGTVQMNGRELFLHEPWVFDNARY